MQISLIILGGPGSSRAPHTALQFARAALAAGHEIYRVFFYQDGTALANSLAASPQDEANYHQLWAELAQQHRLDVVVCVSAAARRGILDAELADYHNLPVAIVQPPFTLSGLGQYIDALAHSDRTITFAA